MERFFKRIAILVCTSLIPNIVIAQDIGSDIADLNKRVGNIEETLEGTEYHQYDPYLIGKMKVYVALQEENQKKIDSMSERIESLVKRLNELSDIQSELSFSMNADIKSIRQDLLSSLSDVKKLHSEQINVLERSNNSYLKSAQEAAESADKRLENFLSTMTVVAGFASVLLLIFGAYAGFKIKRTADDAKTAKDLGESSKKLQSELKSELDHLLALRSEVYCIHKLVDVKHTFSVFKAKFGKKDTVALEQYLHSKNEELVSRFDSVITQWKNIQEQTNESKQEFILEAKNNQSYCHAVKGIIYYRKGMFDKSYESFLSSRHLNTAKLPDRLFNLGCLASKLFNNTGLNHYFDTLMDCYLELAESQGQLKDFVNDEDVELSLKEINKELIFRGLAHLILRKKDDPKL